MTILTTTAGRYVVYQNDTTKSWAIQSDVPQQQCPIGSHIRKVNLPKGIVYGYDELYWLPGCPETYASQSSCRPAQKVLRPNKYVKAWEQAMLDAEASRKAAIEAEPTVILSPRGKVLAKAEPVIKQSDEVTLTDYVAQADKMKMADLRAIGNTLGVKARSKAELAKKIWLVQHGQLEVKQPKTKKTTPKVEKKTELKAVPVLAMDFASLTAMKMPALREVGNRYGVKARSKADLANRILDAYHAQQAVEAVAA